MDGNAHLMYSEYMSTNETAHTVNLLQGKKEKPSMKFTKSPVLSRVMELLPLLKESEEAMKGSESDMNIEVTKEDGPFVEMNVTLVEQMDMDERIDMSDEEEESDSEPSEVQNVLSYILHEIEPVLDPSVISDDSSNDGNDHEAPVSPITQEDQQEVSKSDIVPEDPLGQR